MAGYRRFIAYVYDYENGKKGSNCGFIKVEVKDQQCSVEVHLHCPGLPENVMCRIYGFTRKDGLINGILLDSCETEKEIIECLIVTDALNMNESGIALGKMGGMVIITDNGGFFGTEWDDQIIRPENFRELKVETSSDVSASPIDKTSHISDSLASSSDILVSNTSRTSDFPANEASPTSDALDNKTYENISSPNMADINSDNIDANSNISVPINISDSSFTATIQEISIPPEVSEIHTKSPDTFTEVSKSVNASGNNTSTVSSDHTDYNKPNTSFISVDSSRNAIDEGEISKSNPDSVAPQALTQTFNASKEPPKESDSGILSSQQKNSSPKKVSSATTSENPKNHKNSSEFSPFSDGEIATAWKIHLNDLKRFPRQYCALRNNRFIQYGHYNFGHLLLGQKNNGQYILGVPGSYNQQERFMANMFGFPYFKESDYIEMPKTRGGYWYRLIDAPDSHR